MILISCSFKRKIKGYVPPIYSISDMVQANNSDVYFIDRIDRIERNRVHMLELPSPPSPILEIYSNVELTSVESLVENFNNQPITIPEEMVTRGQIINNIDINNLHASHFGVIAYNIPQDMLVNKYSTVKLRISRVGSEGNIIIGNRNIPIVFPDSRDKIVLETINIDEWITAKLFSDSKSFLIESNSSQTQRISDDNSYTEWIWRIKPIKGGDNYLIMTLSLLDRDIVVYEKVIWVNSDTMYNLENWFFKWWQIITTTILIPFLIPVFRYLFHKREKRDRRQN
jgi:hypothetical protein